MSPAIVDVLGVSNEWFVIGWSDVAARNVALNCVVEVAKRLSRTTQVHTLTIHAAVSFGGRFVPVEESPAWHGQFPPRHIAYSSLTEFVSGVSEVLYSSTFLLRLNNSPYQFTISHEDYYLGAVRFGIQEPIDDRKRNLKRTLKRVISDALARYPEVVIDTDIWFHEGRGSAT